MLNHRNPQRIEVYAGSIALSGVSAIVTGLIAGGALMLLGGITLILLGVAGLVAPRLVDYRPTLVGEFPVVTGEIVDRRQPELRDVRAHAPHMKSLSQAP